MTQRIREARGKRKNETPDPIPTLLAHAREEYSSLSPAAGAVERAAGNHGRAHSLTQDATEARAGIRRMCRGHTKTLKTQCDGSRLLPVHMPRTSGIRCVHWQLSQEPVFS